MLTALIMATLWLNDPAAGYNRPSGSAPGYLSPAEKCRWERLRACKLLYQGRHRCFFLDEQRTQFDFPKERVQDRIIQRYITHNLCRLISHTTADLMFGAKAKLDAPSAAQTDRLDELARRSILHSRLHEAAVQMSWAGGAFLESTLWRGEAYVEIVQADEVFPQGRMLPTGQYDVYVRYATDIVWSNDNKSAVTLLLKTIYQPGVIRRELYQLDDGGGVASKDLPLERWPEYQGMPDAPMPAQPTGVELNTITYVANKVGDCVGISDYDGLVELQDCVNAKYAQANRVIAKHSDPKLRVPREAADANGNFPAQADVLFSDTPDAYGYITWEAQLDAAFKDRTEAVLAFCAGAEMSPVLLGIRQGAAPDAARKLRLEATKDLAKVGRKKLIIEPAIARAVELTQRLDQTSSLRRSYPVEAPGVQIRDGLPIDELDQANVISTLRGGQASMSLEAAVEMRIEDPDAAAIEIGRIREERAAATPSVLLGEPGEEPPVRQAQGEAESASEAA